MNDPRGRRRTATLVLAAAVLLGAGLGASDLFNPDEPREAEMAREMYVGRDFLVPRLNAEPFLEKPPLFYWLVTGAYTVAGGPSQAAARLVPALAGLLCVVLVYTWGRRLVGEDGAFLAAIVLLTALEFLWLSRRCVIDLPLTLAVLLACLLLHRGMTAAGPRRGWWLAGGFAATGAAVMFKGLVGAGIPGLAACGYLAARRDWRGFLRHRLPAGFAAALVPAGVWAWLLWRRLGDEAAREFVWVNNVLRFIGGAEGKGHEQPFYYYVPTLLFDFMPWSLLLPLAVGGAWMVARRRDGASGGDSLWWLLAWLVVPFFVLSIASTKRGVYLLPLYPAAALLVGWWLAGGAAGDGGTGDDRSGGGAGGSPGWRAAVVRRPGSLALGVLFVSSLLPGAVIVVLHTMLPGEAVRPLVIALVVLVPASFALAALRDRRAPRCALFCAVMTGAAALAALLHLVPRVVDLAASARPAAAAVRRHADEGDRLAFYDFHQGEMGGILFYAGLTLPNLRDLEALERHLTGPADPGAGRPLALIQQHDYEAVRPLLKTHVTIARRFEPRLRDPRGRPGTVVLLVAPGEIEDNAPGSSARRPPP